MAGERPALEVPPYAAAVVETVRLPGGEHARDRLAVEEPLEVRIDGRPVAVTMRTPGHDEELALGFCLSEGIPARSATVPDDLAANTIEVDAGGFDVSRLERHFYTSSSCGVCGKGALDAVAVDAPPVDADLRVAASLVAALPERLRAEQPTFAATGGLHATGLFGADGDLLCLREDVGRHNAMDKAIGSQLLAGRYPLPGVVACLSGRASFELVQKAALAQLAGLVAVGAPSSLAVELARERRMLLCGFVRGGSFNVYAGADRLRE